MIVDGLPAERAPLAIAACAGAPRAQRLADERDGEPAERDGAEVRHEVVAHDPAVALERLGGKFTGRFACG